MAYTGSLALRLAGIEELLSRSVAFQNRVNAANSAVARGSIYGGELSDVLEIASGKTLEFKRPCAIIGCERHSYQLISQTIGPGLGVNGAVWVTFFDQPDDPQDYKRSLLAFLDWTSRAVDEIATLVGQDYGAADYTLWPFTQISQFIEPYRPDVADRQADDFWLTGYIFADSINLGGA